MLGLVLVVDTHKHSVRLETSEIGKYQHEDHIYTDLLYEYVDGRFLCLVKDPNVVCLDYNNYNKTALVPGYHMVCSNTDEPLPDHVEGVSDLKRWIFELQPVPHTFETREDATTFFESQEEAVLGKRSDGKYIVTLV